MGVNIGYEGPRTYREHHNWPSAIEHAEAVRASIHKDILRGTKAGPYLNPPFHSFVGSPMGCFRKKHSSKHRVIHDLSYPPGSSINDFINIDNYRLQYLSMDDVVAKIKKSGQYTLLSKIDLEDAFKSIPVRPEDWPLLGSTFDYFYPDTGRYEKCYFYDKVLQFGSRSSPKLFTDFAKAANLIMKYNGVTYSDQYLDDYITMGPPGSPICQANLDIMITTCESLGFSLNPNKIVQPTTCLQFLGIVIDTSLMELRISEERLQDILTELDNWSHRRTATKRQLLSLIGKLIFVCRVVRPGRIFVQRLIDLSKTAMHLHHKIRLTTPALLDIYWWQQFLPLWNKTSVFYNDQWVEDTALHLYTDASNIALAAYYDGEWFVVPFVSSTSLFLSMSINWRELCAIALALSTWGPQWQGQKLILHCDNMCVVECINQGSSKNIDIMHLIRNMFYICAHYCFEITARYVNTKDNNIADSLSRLQFSRFRQFAPTASATMTSPSLAVLF